MRSLFTIEEVKEYKQKHNCGLREAMAGVRVTNMLKIADKIEDDGLRLLLTELIIRMK